MRNTRWILPIIVAVLATGCTSLAAGGSDAPVSITVAPYRVGDRIAVASTFGWDDGRPVTSEGRWLAEIRPLAHAVDKYGIERPAYPVAYEWTENGQLESKGDCFVLDGGREAVRRDVAAQGDPYRYQDTLPLVGAPYADIVFTKTAEFRWACDVQVGLGGRTFREGDVLAFAELDSPARLWGGDTFWWPTWNPYVAVSAGAVPVEFHKRPALSFTFRLERDEAPPSWKMGDLTITLADGLPGFVAAEFRGTNATGQVEFLRDAVVGFEPGSGAALVDRGARIPQRDPAATPIPWQQLLFDDSEWPMEYRYADAVAALRADPTTGLDAYLRAHPDAFLGLAAHTARASDDPAHAASEAWTLVFGDAGSCALLTTERPTLAGPLLAQLPVGLHTTSECPWPPPGAQALKGLPQLLAPPTVVAGAAARAGIPAQRAGHVSYNLEDRYTGSGELGFTVRVVEASAVPPAAELREDLTAARIDAVSGGLIAVSRVRVEPPVASLAPPPPLVDAPDESPPRGWRGSLAPAAAVGGLAGLALLARGLAPLYTRIRRSVVLQNRARAALYERIRREPGVSQADLVSRSGVGDGASRYHLDTLAAHGFVLVIEEARRVRYFAAGEVPALEARRLALLASGSLHEVYDLFAAQPELSLRQAGQRLGMSAPSVWQAKRRLEREGLLPAPVPPLATARP